MRACVLFLGWPAAVSVDNAIRPGHYAITAITSIIGLNVTLPRTCAHDCANLIPNFMMTTLHSTVLGDAFWREGLFPK